MKIDIKEEIDIPEGVEVKLDAGLLTVKGPKGSISRAFKNSKINIEIKDQKVILSSKKATKREKRMLGSFYSHIENMLKGVNKVYVYTLKICSTHFPMTVSINKNQFSVQNFLGEKIPRVVSIKPGVEVKIASPEITVESVDKELAGQTAAAIEQSCRISNRDRRIFQDGIFITSKAKKER